jgi:hypothetical protein
MTVYMTTTNEIKNADGNDAGIKSTVAGLRTDTVCVVGNGLSREGIDIDGLRRHGLVIGCNWIYRDFTPDIVTAIDSPSQEDVMKRWNGKPPFHQLNQNLRHTHAMFDRQLLGIITFNDPPFFNNSGLYSAWFAVQWLKAKTLYLYGMDFFRPVPGRVNAAGKPTNDIYGINTINNGVDRCWLMLHRCYPSVRLVRVGPVIESDREWYKEKIEPFMELVSEL